MTSGLTGNSLLDCTMSRKQLEESVNRKDTQDAVACMSDMLSFILQGFNQAARHNDKRTVEEMIRCYDNFSLRCSGHLMEDLLTSGNTELAQMFIDSGRWWGSAKTRWEQHAEE